jgi:hypothetical protein
MTLPDQVSAGTMQRTCFNHLRLANAAPAVHFCYKYQTCSMDRANSRASKRGVGRPRGPGTQVVRLPLPVANLARRLANQTLRAGDINEFLDVEARTHLTVPLVDATVACGFPSRPTTIWTARSTSTSC